MAVFAAAALGDLLTYVVTSIQLALATGDGMLKFLTIFAVTQIPLAIAEGLLTVVVFTCWRSTARTSSRRSVWCKEGNEMKVCRKI